MHSGLPSSVVVMSEAELIRAMLLYDLSLAGKPLSDDSPLALKRVRIRETCAE